MFGPFSLFVGDETAELIKKSRIDWHNNKINQKKLGKKRVGVRSIFHGLSL